MRMKKLIAIVLAATLLWCIPAGCSKKADSSSGKEISDIKTKERDNGNEAVFELAEAKSGKTSLDTDKLNDAYLEFVFGMMNKCASGAGKENVLISPDSVFFTMMMASAGANGETLDQMTETMVLANTITFDARWQDPYDEYERSSQEFRDGNGEKKSVKFLHDTEHVYFNNGKADFSNMTSESVFIGSVLHKTFIKVTPEGTQAAAATTEIMTMGLGPEDEIWIVCDRPFAYAIVDTRTGLPVFLGTVETVEQD